MLICNTYDLYYAIVCLQTQFWSFHSVRFTQVLLYIKKSKEGSLFTRPSKELWEYGNKGFHGSKRTKTKFGGEDGNKDIIWEHGKQDIISYFEA